MRKEGSDEHEEPSHRCLPRPYNRIQDIDRDTPIAGVELEGPGFRRRVCAPGGFSLIPEEFGCGPLATPVLPTLH